MDTKRPDPSLTCRVCDSSEVSLQVVQSRTKRFQGKTLDFHVCKNCGYIRAPANAVADQNADRSSAVPLDANDSRPGREFFMFQTALEILGRPVVDVLFIGPGSERDSVLASGLSAVRSSCVADVAVGSQQTSFVPLEPGSRFDIVVCCESTERFDDPVEAFAELLSLVEPQGLLVVSTNVSDGAPLDKLAYPFMGGHVSYYSGRSLSQIAEKHGFVTDFRLPKCALAEPGPRKRYVFFYREPGVHSRIALWFSKHTYALSEPPRSK